MMVEIETQEMWPIVYRKEYNVKFFGLEKLHPFDSKKWGHIYKVSVTIHLTTGLSYATLSYVFAETIVNVTAIFIYY